MTQAQIEVGAAPSPEHWVVQPVEVQGKTLLAVQIYSVNGLHVTFLDAASAHKIAADIERTAATMDTGLILPAGVVLPG